MIFINRYADYSANKIGTIEIPQEFDPTASAIMSKYSKVITDEQKLAFNQFILNMKAAGIYDKIEFLYIPCLAGSVSEAFYEVINNVTQDMSDTSTYGQYSLDTNGLQSTYDSQNAYTPKTLSITRSTYDGTVSCLMHLTTNLSGYGFMLQLDSNAGKGVKASNAKSNIKHMQLAMNRNKYAAYNFASNIGNTASIVHSFIPTETSWSPSQSNSKAICNGEVVGEIASTFESAITVNKTNTLCLAGYTAYGSGFDCKNSSLDILAISANLNGVPCTNDSSKNMDVRMDELIMTFKTAFFV